MNLNKNRMKNLFKISAAVALTIAVSFTACKDDEGNVGGDNEEAKVADFISNYANIVSANYTDSYNTAVAMQTKINAFLAAPSEAGLVEAQEAWLYARNFYGQTEAFRQAKGPIDTEDLLGTEGQINAWPLDEGFIDYVSDNRGAEIQNGLIGDETFELSEANILGQNEANNVTENVSTGWHAIEFLLWGQDLNYNPETNTADNFSGSGERPYTDYTTADFAERRGEYLSVVTDLLVADLKDLNDTWVVGGSYRTTFEDLDEDTALTNILNGIGFISNGEVAAERLDPAIDEGQENEHSCFSDNTTQDMWANVTGLNNVIVGSYITEAGTTVSGTSLIEIVSEANVETATNLTTAASTAITKLEVLTGLTINFDEIISQESFESVGPAGELSQALKDQGEAIAEAATALNVSISISE